MSGIRRCTWVALLAVVTTGVRAENLPAARSCGRLSDGMQRLACYDAAFGSAPVAAQAAPGVAPAKPSTAPPLEFGDNGQLPQSVQAKAAVPKRLQAKVESVTTLPGGMFRLRLDNGQVWDTHQSDWALDFQASDAVTIDRMVLGGYQISVARHGGRSVSVRRVE